MDSSVWNCVNVYVRVKFKVLLDSDVPDNNLQSIMVYSSPSQYGQFVQIM